MDDEVFGSDVVTVDAWDEHEQRRLGGVRRIIGDIFFDDSDGEEPYDDPDGGDFDDVPEDDSDEVPEESQHVEKVAVKPSWVNSRIDTDKMMSDLFRPGTNHVTDGLRGGGKTFQAVAYSEAMVKGVYPSMQKVVLLTNIIFVKRVRLDGPFEEQFEMETPPDVYHVTSMEAMFRVMTKLLRKHGRTDVMFLLVLDEAQNFLLADEYQQDTSINFIKLYGTTRKFNMCIWLLTPSINNLPPRARNFLDADPSGYVTCQWRKNKQAAVMFIREHHTEGIDPRELTTMKMGQNAMPVWFRVTGTSWTRPLEELGVGEYGYDHLANADFKVSISRDPERAFDFTEFMERCSDVPSYKIASVMQNFFDRMDGKAPPDDGDFEQKVDPKEEKTAEIRRMRELGLTFDNIEYITGVAASTCRLWLKKYGDSHSAAGPDGAGSPTRTGGGGPVRSSRGRLPKGVSREGSVNPKTVVSTSENTPEKGTFSGYSKNVSVAQNSDSQHFAQQQRNPPSDAPYISIPRDPPEEGVFASGLPEAPRTVGGQLTPDGATGDDGEEESE